VEPYRLKILCGVALICSALTGCGHEETQAPKIAHPKVTQAVPVVKSQSNTESTPPPELKPESESESESESKTTAPKLNLSLPANFTSEEDSQATNGSDAPNRFDIKKEPKRVTVKGQPFINVDKENYLESEIEGGKVSVEIKTK